VSSSTLHNKSMATVLSKLIETFESLWPLSGAEEWDRPGLSTGSRTRNVSKVLLSVDVTNSVLSEAKEHGCELVLSHHPVLLKGVSFLAEDQLKGELIAFAIKNDIALYSAHTNADIVAGGISDTLAQVIGLTGAVPLVETSSGIGHGRIGKLSKSLTLKEFAKHVQSTLPENNAPIRIAGDLQGNIQTVAVVGGAGDSFIGAAQASGADCLVTSDLRHHLSLDAATDPSKPICLIDISHFAAESLWLEPTAKKLSSLHSEVEFIVSKTNTDPWSMSLAPGV